jgi:hypothetical protein
MRRVSIIAVLGFAFIAQRATAADEIHLVCSGDSSRSMIDGMASLNGSNGSGGYVNGSAMSVHREHQADEVYVDIADGKGRIKLPGSLVPLIAGGGKDGGWRDFQSLTIGSDVISAKLSLNVLNNPKVTISRLTGHIDIAELKRSFSGDCQPYDPQSVQRKF